MADKQLQFEATVSAGELNKLLRELETGAQGASKAINDALGGTVTKKLLLETVTDESGARRLVAVEKERLSAADQINNKLKQLDKTQRGSLTSLRQQVNEARQLRDGITRYADAIGGIGGQLRTVNPLWAAQNARVAELQRQLDLAGASGFWSQVKTGFRLQGFISFLNGLTEITQGLQSATIVVGQFTGAINDLVNSAADLQSFALSFKAIGAGSAGAIKGLQDSAKIALGLGVNLQTVQDGFKQLSPVILNSGGSLQDVSNIVEALSSRFAAYGIAGDKARRVTNGVIQAFAKGKLQAEELTQQISEADPAFKAELTEAIKASITELKGFGDASDFTVQKLEQFVKQGKITTDVLIKVLPALSKADLLFGKLGPTANSAVDALASGSVTIDQVSANLDNLGKLNLRNIAKIADPLIEGFLRVRAVVTDFFTRLSESSTAQTLVNVFGKIVNIVARVIDSFLAVADGVLSITNAIAPFVDILLKIPGTLELVGLALVGKLLKNFGLLKQNVQEGAKSLVDFASSAKSTFTGIQAPIAAAQKPVVEFRKRLEEPISNSLTSGLREGTKQVVASTKQAIGQVGVLEASASSGVSKAVETTQSRIRKLYQELQKLKAEAASVGSAQVTAPREVGMTDRISSAPIDQAAAATERWEKSVGAVTLAFDRTIQGLDRLDASVNSPARKLDVIRRSIEKTSLVIREIGGQGVNLISPEFIASARELASTDPAKAVRALQFALRGLQTESSETRVTPLAEEAQRAIREQANAAKSAISDIIKGNTALARSQSDIGPALQGVSTKIQETEQRARELASELGKKPSSGGVDSAISDQKRLQAELNKTIRELSKLYAKEQSLKAGQAISRRQGVGLSPEGLKQEATALDLIQQKITAVRVEQARTSNSRIKSIDAEIAATKESLKAIENNIKARAELAKQFRLPIQDAGKPTDLEVESADKLRDKLAQLNTERASAITLVENNAKAESNLSAALDKAGDAVASYEQRQRGVSQAAKSLSTFLGVTGKEVQGITEKIKELEKARNNLLRQQSARPFAGPVDRQKDPLLLQIDDLGSQINNLKAKLGELNASRQLAFDGLEDLGTVFEENERKAGKLGGAFSRLRDGFKGFVGGVVAAPFRALGGLFASARVAVVGLLQALGPLQVILIAAGVASRLYADGNRRSAEITKEFTESTELLNAALKDLNPEAQKARQGTSALGRAWQALANVTAGVGNQIGDFLEEVAQNVEELVSVLGQSINPLGDLLAKLALIGGGGVLGAFIGSLVAPGIGTFIGGALGGTASAILGLSLGVSEADSRIAALEQTLKTLGTEFMNQAPVIQALTVELDKLAKGGVVEPKSLTKYLNGLQALEQAAAAARKQYNDAAGALKENEDAYDSNIKKLEELRAALAKAAAERDRLQGEKNTRSPLAGFTANSEELSAAAKRVDDLKAQIADLEEETIKLGQSNNISAQKLAGLRKELEESEQAFQARRKQLGLTTSDQEDLLNSTQKLAEQIKNLNAIADETDLSAPGGAEKLRSVLSRAEALQEIINDIKKTEIEISIEATGIEQSIVESQIKIDLPEGPLREAKLAVSEITNELALAQQEFQRTIAGLELIRAEGKIEPGEAARQLEQAAKVYLDATLKGKAAIIDAAKGFKDQLAQARSSYQDLVLSKPEFFTSTEIRANALQIERDFSAALAKVRQQSGDAFFFPKGVVSLEDKKAFVDARKQADDLVSSIQQLNQVLAGLALVLAQINNVSLEQLQAAGFDPKVLIKNAQEAQTAITGVSKEVANGAQQIASAYSEVTGSAEINGQKLVFAYNLATGALETLTEAQYRNAQATGQALPASESLSQNYIGIATSAEQAATGVERATDAIEQQPDQGPSTLAEQYDAARARVLEFYGAVQKAPEASSELEGDIDGAASSLQSGVAPANNVADALASGATQAENIANAISRLDGLSVNVNVNGVAGLWTGGPTTAGQTYRVNELGQEGFLSAGGSLSAIRKPKNALWRAPSAGTVIPAHIWSEIDAPKGGVQARRASGMPVASSGVMRMMQAIKSSAGGGASYGMRELAQTQAQQSHQIGKLAGAIQEMTGKEWKVDLNINGNNPLLNKLRKR